MASLSAKRQHFG